MYIPLKTFGGVIGVNTENVSGNLLSVVLKGLQEYVNYNISIRAYTSVGAGPYSGTVRVLTNEDGEFCNKKKVNQITKVI